MQYRQLVIDERGNPTGEVRPPNHIHMPSGDLRQYIISNHSHRWPPTSANAFRRTVLRRLLPMPEGLYRMVPDLYLCNLSAVLGPIFSLDEVGIRYRIHGKNTFTSSAHRVNNDLLRSIRMYILATVDAHNRQKELLNSLYPAAVREIGSRDSILLSFRVISSKLDPLNHPLKESLLALCVRGCVLSVTHPYPSMLNWYARPIYTIWFLAMLLVPKGFAQYLAEALLFRERRGHFLNKVVSLVRKNSRSRATL